MSILFISIHFPQLPVKPSLIFRTTSRSAPAPARISQTGSSPSIRPALKQSMLQFTMRLFAPVKSTMEELLTQETARTSRHSCEKTTAQNTGILTAAGIRAVTRAMGAGPAPTLTTSTARKTTQRSASTPSYSAITIRTATMLWTKTLTSAMTNMSNRGTLTNTPR